MREYDLSFILPLQILGKFHIVLAPLRSGWERQDTALCPSVGNSVRQECLSAPGPDRAGDTPARLPNRPAPGGPAASRSPGHGLLFLGASYNHPYFISCTFAPTRLLCFALYGE